MLVAVIICIWNVEVQVLAIKVDDELAPVGPGRIGKGCWRCSSSAVSIWYAI